MQSWSIIIWHDVSRPQSPGPLHLLILTCTSIVLKRSNSASKLNQRTVSNLRHVLVFVLWKWVRDPLGLHTYVFADPELWSSVQILICRNESEQCLIEGSINSLRISIRVKHFCWKLSQAKIQYRRHGIQYRADIGLHIIPISFISQALMTYLTRN